MAINWLAVIVSAALPLIFGYIWYSAPVAKLFKSYKGDHKHHPGVFVACYVMGIPLAILMSRVYSLHDVTYQVLSHGLFHGIMSGALVIAPVMFVHFLFEGERSLSNMVYHILYYVISLGLIGGAIFAFGM